MIAPSAVISVSLQPDTYITDGILVASSGLLGFATSNQTVKLYSAATGSFVRDLTGHTAPITDLASFGASAPSGPSVLLSAQRDTGIMVTDLRDATQRPQYLTELQGSGLECFGMAVSPSGNQLALSAGCDIHILDPRMSFRSVRHIPDIHTDVITKLRFVTESTLATGGEDMMFNIVNAHAQSECDLIVSSMSWGEAPNRISVVRDRFVTATGSCEGSLVQPIPQNCDRVEDADWALELRIQRPPMGQYVIDFTSLGDDLGMLVGERPGAEDDIRGPADGTARYDVNPHTGQLIFPGDCEDRGGAAAPQRLSLVRVTERGVQPDQRIALAPVHRDDVRCVVAVPSSLSSASAMAGGGGNRVVTAGEDGCVCFWDLSGEQRQTAPVRRAPPSNQRPRPGVDARSVQGGGGDRGGDDDGDDEESPAMTHSSSSSGGKELRQRGTRNRLAGRGGAGPL